MEHLWWKYICSLQALYNLYIKNMNINQVLVAHAYNPSYLWGWDRIAVWGQIGQLVCENYPK
jgi:hypothetical protein